MNSIAETVKENILIVDDSPENLRLLSRMLTRQGYEVRSAIHGSLALTAIQRMPPDLVLLDISMPDLDGYEVCAVLKANAATREIPVIFISAYGEALNKVKAFKAGGVDYITKPFQLEEVLVRIENQLHIRRLQVDLQQAKADALRALEQERDLNRLRSEFMSILSHDFRTPLTSIQGFAGLLQEAQDALTPEQKQRYFDRIDAVIEHMLHLLDKVLLVSDADGKVIHCQPVPLDLEQFCCELLETFQLDQTYPVSIQFDCLDACLSANLDPTLLRQILINLLSNAAKYSPPDRLIRFTLQCRADQAIFQIQDQGIGIPAENQKYLFEAFYRGQNTGQIRGTGLGLAAVKKCVDAHKGHITLQSQEGVGTTVTLCLPLSLPPLPKR